jgi:hypothetical protein
MEKAYPERNPDIVARKEEKEALLFNPADGNMLCTNRTGVLVWELCDGAHDVEGMAREITDKYEVSFEKAEKDCLTYLKELEQAGFICYKI